jgi:hypothetical protein
VEYFILEIDYQINDTDSQCVDYIRCYFKFKSCGSSVSIVSDYRVDERCSIPGKGKGFFL